MENQLSFEVFLSDSDFKKRVNADIALAEKFNTTVGRLLIARQKVSGLSVAEARAAKITQQEAIAQQKLATEIQRTIAATDRAALAKAKLENANKRAANSEKKLASSIQSTSNNFSVQGRLLSNLKTLGTAYVSVFAAERFTTTLAKVSGEFELQRVSLRAILQDAQGADKIFNQIKGFAVESPYEFKDLISYTKQLSAFSVPIEELYDTTKRLADISSGLGVDMGRIILAYGQVRSAAVLRGQELRQFTEAGIPLVDQLAKKFSELEGRVVSAGEVFDKISKRMVPFQMIKDIFTELTSDGGMFFEMQEKQAQTLAGKISNLRDAYNLMLADIGDANSGTLKSGVDLIRSLFENWETVVNYIKAAGVAFGTFVVMHKVAGPIFNSINKEATKLIHLTTDFGPKMSKSQAMAVVALRRTESGFKSLKNTIAANKWTLILTAIAAIGTAVYNWYQNSRALRNELEKINTTGSIEAKNLSDSFKKLADEIVNANDGSIKQNELMQKLKRTYSDYLNVNDLTVQSLRDMKGAYDSLTGAIYDKAKADAYEKGIQAINEKYNPEQTENVNSLREHISGFKYKGQKISEKDVENIINKIIHQVNETLNVGEAIPANIVSRTVMEYFKTDKIAAALSGGGKADLVAPIGLSGIKDYVRTREKYFDELKKFEKNQAVLFSEAIVNTKEEADTITSINENFEKEKNDIRLQGAKNNKEASEVQDALKVVEINRLKALIAYYDKYGEKSDYGKKQAAKYRVELEKLTEVEAGWRSKVGNVITGRSEGAVFNVQQDETLVDYIRRLREEYKRLNEELNTLDGAYESEKEIADIRKQMTVLKELSNALKISLIEKKTDTSGDKDVIAQYKYDLEELKSAYKSYLEQTELFGEDIAAKNINNLFGIDFSAENLGEKAEKIFSSIEKINSESATKMRKDWDKWFGKEQENAIRERFKKVIEGISNELDKWNENFDFYKTLKEHGLSEDAAQNIAFGIKLDVKPDEIRENVKSLEKIINETFKTTDFTLSTEKDLLSQVQERYGLMLPPELLKKIEDTTKFIQSSYRTRLLAAIEYSNNTKDVEGRVVDIERVRDEHLQSIKDALLTGNISEDEYNILFEKITNNAQREIDELRMQAIELTDFWRTLFGDLDDISGSALLKTEKTAKDVIKQANDPSNQIKDKNGKVTGYKVTIDGKETEVTAKGLSKIAKGLKAIRNAYGSGYDNIVDGVKNLFDSLFNSKGDDGEKKSPAERIFDISRAVKQLGGDLSEAGIISDEAAQQVGNFADMGMGAARVAMNPADIGGWDQAIGGAVKFFSTLFSNDKHYQRLIEESQRRVKKLQNAYEDLDIAVENALGTGIYDYQADQIKNLREQGKELQLQADLERRKKNANKDTIEDLERQSKEAYQEAAKLIKQINEEILGSSIKDLAHNLGDALVDAFLRGEDAAQAWGKSVSDIVADITKRMLIQKLLEEPIGTIIKNYESKWDVSSEGDVASRVLDTLPEMSEDLKAAYLPFLQVLNNLPDDLKDLLYASSEAGDSLSSGIQGVTEDTAGLLASYINAIRQDVSINKYTMVSILTEMSRWRVVGTEILMYTKMIEANTMNTANAALEAATAAKRAAEASESINKGIKSVISPNKYGSGSAINVNA